MNAIIKFYTSNGKKSYLMFNTKGWQVMSFFCTGMPKLNRVICTETGW
jgi:hypothetical protein